MIYGLPIMLVTAVAPNIYLFYLFWAICGLGGGPIETYLNVYCLDIWQGHSGGGPWMHSIQFAYSLGATIGPILTAPFLSETSFGARTMVSHHHSHLVPNVTLITNDTYKESRIDKLYPISGAVVLTSSLGFLVMAVQSSMRKMFARNKDSVGKKVVDKAKDDTKEYQQKTTLKLVTFVVLICIFFFLYMGAEIVMGVYLTTFAVKSLLHTTKAEGAYVNAVFWGTFTAGRFLSISDERERRGYFHAHWVTVKPRGRFIFLDNTPLRPSVQTPLLPHRHLPLFLSRSPEGLPEFR